MIDRLKRETNQANDIIYKEILINDNKITLIYSDVLTSGADITNYILKKAF